MSASNPASSSHDPCELTTSRVVAASPDAVFGVFLDPVRLARWWGPAGFTNTFSEFDFRPGGDWRFVMHGPDGGNYRNHSVFTEIVPGERIVIEHRSPPTFSLTVTLAAEAGGRTRVGWTQRFPTPEDRNRIATFAAPANEENLDRLEAELARGP